MTYDTITTSKGRWLCSTGEDILIAYIDNSWSKDDQEGVLVKFLATTETLSSIKNAVQNSTGQTVINGLYGLNEQQMTRCMNSLKDLGKASSKRHKMRDKGTSKDVIKKLLTTVIPDLAEDTSQISKYFEDKLNKAQSQIAKNYSMRSYGIMIGTITLDRLFKVPRIYYKYASCSNHYRNWLVDLNCEYPSYDYYNFEYTLAVYR